LNICGIQPFFIKNLKQSKQLNFSGIRFFKNKILIFIFLVYFFHTG